MELGAPKTSMGLLDGSDMDQCRSGVDRLFDLGAGQSGQAELGQRSGTNLVDTPAVAP